MGNRIEVTAWVPVPGTHADARVPEAWHDEPRYGGDSIVRALWVAARVRFREHRCATIYWRPRG